MLIVNDRIAIPESELAIDFARSGGPGGQNVNKVASKAILRWNPGTSQSLPEPVRARLISKLGNRLTNEGDLIVTSQAHARPIAQPGGLPGKTPALHPRCRKSAPASTPHPPNPRLQATPG